jgi:hypothetical protein
MAMPHRFLLHACVFVLTAAYAQGVMPLSAAERGHFSDPYSIMAPEPWLAPKYNSPRNLPQKPDRTRTQPLPRSSVGSVASPPPTVLPNGQSVPNLPTVNRGFVPGGGAETFGDRAARCAHQSGLYGVPAGQQGAYMSSCVQ